MARRSSKVFAPVLPSATAPTTNRDGYPAWERPIEEQFLQTLLTNTFGNTYYVKQADLIKESKAVHSAMLAKDVKFYARALCYARNDGYMRLQPIYGLARLSEVDTKLFERVFGEVIRTPNDLMDFTAIVMSRRKGSQGGRAIKRVVGKWLTVRLNEYWVIKYGSERKDGNSLSLNGMLRVYHPKGGDNPLMKYLINGEYDPKVLPKIAAFEDLKRASTDEEKIDAIQRGQLPHEVATSFASSKAVWNAILPNLPIFALLRNLNTLSRHDVLDDNKALVTEVLTDRERITKSMILPHQFLKAMKVINKAWAKDAVRDAVEIAFNNLPELDGKTVVALDRSGSMHGDNIETAAIFAVSLMKKTNYQGRLFTFNTKLDEVAVSYRDSILTQAEKINAQGGTDTQLPLRKMLSDGLKADNFIMITDEQQNAGTPFADVLKEYRRKVNPEVKTFIIDIAPYRAAMVPDEWKNVWFIYGWSDQVLSFISMVSRGFASIVDYVNQSISLD